MTVRRAVLASLIAAPAFASACATCGVDPGSSIAEASNSVLWMLLGLVAFIFISTGLTALYLWRRAVAPIPEHIQLVENLTAEPEEI
jgi:hypothetical protein